METMTAKWSAAKADFITAQKAVSGLLKQARAEAKAACGQEVSLERVVKHPLLASISCPHILGAYGKTPTLREYYYAAADGCPASASQHWPAELADTVAATQAWTAAVPNIEAATAIVAAYL